MLRPQQLTKINPPVFRDFNTSALTPEERDVFNVLVTVAGRFSATVRAAGGWVRDKLLGLESNDIDIALDTVDGETFAHAVRGYTLQNTEFKISSIGEIKANPAQSKHLLTATFSINGIDLDTNNLRAESYADNSRIPEIRFGSPLEDAERRDFTINSLFFNANSGKIEDWTGLGLSDLEKGTLRTPLDPYSTFRDDPLRMVRAVRFASRFGLHVEPNIVTALQDTKLCESLTVKTVNGISVGKLSGDRMGQDLGKLFNIREKKFPGSEKAGSAFAGIKFMANTQIAQSILKSVTQEAQVSWPHILRSHQNSSTDVSQCLHDLPAIDLSELPDRQHRLLMLALFACPLRNMNIMDGKKIMNCGCYLYRSVLHLPKIDYEGVGLIFTHLADWEEISSFYDQVDLRVKVGRLLRILKDDWKVLSLLSQMLEFSSEENSQCLRLKQFHVWVSQSSGLEGCWQWTPHYDGSALISRFSAKKGPGMSKLVELQWDLMFLNSPKEVIDSQLQQAVGAQRDS